ncbi:hypothetical protein HanXRQr2_Chr06g0240411 [Helianthus annuus]|uniref:Uncharacterized protein n=1 Tax=Helianthus annuus TaxID=4232 RepID=A0A9K3NHQ6_HELAN|nr:hypothetical protein HanXRQr2_Chr06g0240411 [Helianthus annuus]
MLKVPRAHQKSTSKSLTLNHRYKVKEHRKWGCVVLETKQINHLSLTLNIHNTLRKRRPCADTHFNKN